MNISTLDATSRNEYIMTALDRAGVMFRRFAYSYQLDAEELAQDCAVEMLEARIPAGCDPIAYLYGVARMHCRQILARTEWTVSLDEPRCEDGKKTLADTLPADTMLRSEEEIAHLEKVTEVVYAALRECRLEEQEYARETFELLDYAPVPSAKQAYHGLLKQERRTDNLLRSIKRVFRKHPQVQGLIQRETCVL